MPRGDWGKFAKNGALVTLCVALMGALGWYAYGAHQLTLQAQHDSREASRYYSDDAGSRVRQTCGALVDEAQADCINQAYDAARKNQRDERDLESQRIMAAWTAVMGGMATVGIALSAFAVYLIYITFGETRRAANTTADAVRVARETAYRELRPYVYFDRAEFVPGHNIVRVFAKNYGQTPAYDCTAIKSARVMDFPIDKSIELAPQALEAGKFIIPPTHSYAIIGEYSDNNIIEVSNGRCLAVTARIFYSFRDDSGKIQTDFSEDTFIFRWRELKIGTGRTIREWDRTG